MAVDKGGILPGDHLTAARAHNSSDVREPSESVDSDSDESRNVGSDDDAEDQGLIVEDDEQCRECGSAPSTAGKLWSPAQFPEGMSAHKNWDMDNLKAAQAWSCPCDDRHNCIGADRIQLTQLYEYRKEFRTTTSQNNGGLRDACRKMLGNHYDRIRASFTRSFVVGDLGDCCAASAGLAAGLSFQTYANARTDVTKDRELARGRRKMRARQESEKRAHFRAYIRSMRNGMEGPKGGANPSAKWHTAYMTRAKRWQQYVEHRRRHKLPVVGSSHLFHKVWDQCADIAEEKSTGHSRCDTCSGHDVRRDKLEGRNDEVGRQLLAQLREEEEAHAAEHLGEREYAEDWWHYGETQLAKCTAFSMDAPTEKQFDIPVQSRKARDVNKSLDGAKKWSSKITGLLIAGVSPMYGASPRRCALCSPACAHYACAYGRHRHLGFCEP